MHLAARAGGWRLNKLRCDSASVRRSVARSILTYASQLENGIPQRFATRVGLRAVWQGLGVEGPGQGLHGWLLFTARQLVDLGCDQQNFLANVARKSEQFSVVFGHAAADVDDENDAAQPRASGQEVLDHWSPGAALNLAAFSVAISREIDEVEHAQVHLDSEQVQATGTTWRAAGTDQFAAIEQGVDQARLAHIRAAGERDFGEHGRRQLGHIGSGSEEVGAFDLGKHGRGVAHICR